MYLFFRTLLLQVLLERDKWYPILRDFGQYPDKYRIALWTSSLQLPRNYSLVSSLIKKGLHPSFTNLRSSIKFENETLLNAMQK